MFIMNKNLIVAAVGSILAILTLIIVSAYTNRENDTQSNQDLTAGIISEVEDIRTNCPALVVQNDVVEVAEPPYSMEDLECLAHVINGEAGVESERCKYYVGSVVLNRVASKHYPNTIQDVVFQSGQYQCTWDGNYDREPSDACYEIAEDLLVNGSSLPSNVLYQAEFKQGSRVYEKIGKTYFCVK